MAADGSNFIPGADANNGVCQHSQACTDDSYIIFSTREHFRTVMAFFNRNDIGYKSVTGTYKGEEEQGWLINAKHWLASRYLAHDQESVLLLGPMQGETRARQARQATLVYMDPMRLPEALGRFIEADPEPGQDYTRDNGTGIVYTCERD